MWPRYFLGRMYKPVPYTVYGAAQAPDTVWSVPDTDSQPYTLNDLVSAVLRRMGDAAGSIWTRNEVSSYLTKGYRELAAATLPFWDQVYQECRAPGFSSTSPWEAQYEDFTYGVANYTLEAEKPLETEPRRLGWANHTCPDEPNDNHLVDCSAAIAAAVSELPATLLQLERATWDNSTIEALKPSELAKADTRFQKTEGEVFGYTWRQDGVRSFRKVRIPSSQADFHTIDGTWGILRLPTDISADTVTGTWGVARRIPTQHPIGTSVWGIPRRPYRDGKNVRVDHYREGRPLAANEDSELPYHYLRYLRDYAQAMAYGRSGPGQDNKLAAHYWERWMRGLARIKNRKIVLQHPRTGGFKTPPPVLGAKRPPRPKLPWAYGKELR